MTGHVLDYIHKTNEEAMLQYNSGDEVALANDARGESNWRGRMPDRCVPFSLMGARYMKASNALHDRPVDGVASSLPFFSRWARWAFNREWRK